MAVDIRTDSGTYPTDQAVEITGGQESMLRSEILTAGVGMGASQRLNLSFFRARVGGTYTTFNVYSGSTAAGATPTLLRFGVFSVASDDAITLIGSTANDTTMLAATTTKYTKALSASVSLTAGSRYAFGVLVVTGAALPALYGASTMVAALQAEAPRLCARVESQADLPASVAGGSLLTTTNRFHAWLS